jgi:hypothetical protein
MFSAVPLSIKGFFEDRQTGLYIIHKFLCAVSYTKREFDK